MAFTYFVTVTNCMFLPQITVIVFQESGFQKLRFCSNIK